MADAKSNENSAPLNHVPHTDGKSLMVLILGIAGIVIPVLIFPVIALIMAPGAVREYHESNGSIGNLGYIKWGKILSWISIALTAINVLFFILFFGLFLASGAAHYMSY